MADEKLVEAIRLTAQLAKKAYWEGHKDCGSDVDKETCAECALLSACELTKKLGDAISALSPSQPAAPMQASGTRGPAPTLSADVEQAVKPLIDQAIDKLTRPRGKGQLTDHKIRVVMTELSFLLSEAMKEARLSALLPAPAWNCPKDCRYLRHGDPSTRPNADEGGCGVEDRIPAGITLEVDAKLPTCPHYAPAPVTAEKLADWLRQYDIDNSDPKYTEEAEALLKAFPALRSEPAELPSQMLTHKSPAVKAILDANGYGPSTGFRFFVEMIDDLLALSGGPMKITAHQWAKLVKRCEISGLPVAALTVTHKWLADCGYKVEEGK